MCLGGLRRFDAPRELSFLLRIDRCSASQSNDLDGLASSINHVSSLRVLRDALVSERALVRASSLTFMMCITNLLFLHFRYIADQLKMCLLCVSTL